MLRGMDAQMLAEWMAFDQVEPVSLGFRGDVQAAQIASTIANVNRDASKRKQPYEIEDFLVRYDEKKEPKPEEVWSKVKAWATRYKL